ncbi:hypothetical protein AALP_AA8G382600 [Arabis alpina]|uniref:NAC domain-containing protein n=1 Tax=Arabis alpina TaxID=50452 RepID=A0A087GC39_ARAAL|nr:hypothetical protein AALP_AA8G382600 [Arabis alpina]
MSDYYEEDEGIHFEPYDDELIKDYLIPELKGESCYDFIVHKNVYDMEAWLLDHNMDPFFQKNEWYYFVTRVQVSEKKIGYGKQAKRKIAGDNNDGIERGNWKANATTNIEDRKTGKIVGRKQTLTYTRSDDNPKRQKREDGSSVIVPGSESSWIMTEYMLPEGENFQELVLCKIKIIKSKKNHYEASTSTSTSTYHHHESVLASSSSSEACSSGTSIAAGEGNAPLGHGSCVPTGSEEERGWIQYFDLPVNEGLNGLIAAGEGNAPLQINEHVSALDTSSEKQPINETHREESENLGPKSTQKVLKELEESLLGVNEPGLRVEEDKEELLIYNKEELEDLFNQFAALCPTKTSHTC